MPRILSSSSTESFELRKDLGKLPPLRHPDVLNFDGRTEETSLQQRSQHRVMVSAMIEQSKGELRDISVQEQDHELERARLQNAMLKNQVEESRRRLEEMRTRSRGPTAVEQKGNEGN